MGLLVVGSVALDDIETPQEKRTDVVGGSATYFAAAAALVGVPARMVGVVGDDFPEHALDALRARGTDTTGVVRVPGETFHWCGRYHEDPNQRDTLDTRLGVFAEFAPALPEGYRDSATVFLANIDPPLQLNVLEQTRGPRFVALDTMNFWIEGKPDELKQVLARVDALLINDSEAHELSGERSLLAAAAAIRAMGPSTLVIKLGQHGAMLFREDGLFSVPALPLERVLDPTGAGDSFAGGYIAALHILDHAPTAEDHRRAMVVGSAAASFTVEGFGVEGLLAADRAGLQRRIARFVELTRIPEPVLR